MVPAVAQLIRDHLTITPPALSLQVQCVVVGSKGLGRDVPGSGCAGEMGEVGMLSAARTGSFKKKGP